MARLFSALALVLSLVATSPALAQTPGSGMFASYEQMRATLDQLMSTRQITQLLTMFGGADEISQADMAQIEGQVRALFPRDFTGNAVMLRQPMGGGFQQELIAYWEGGTNYIYARLLFHTRPEGGVVALNMTFNSDPDVLIPLF
ncbi:hypothetical protein roselon_02714 [Roseibacterium elongatum DSM 19469]|uniref:DUF3887 domain-containing protein n=1 Tax=Roseicyclus elongatus DSM 19469 TaxID=1294273 RepID=W8RUU8_9RHOB|nr:hypothetical protein [Roseibacterium elongatum]AHM05013.1 hypothetical protein roselon_02714 [Roseibacterium elongatum DSM 19469]